VPAVELMARERESAMKRIGIQWEDYPEKRNITSLNRDRVCFEVVPDDLTEISQGLLDQRAQDWLFRKYSTSPSKNTLDCFHYFNALPLNSVPFVCTFESGLPRWYTSKQVIDRGVEILKSASCKRLFAISRSAMALNAA
jgi:hypothetical protein